MNTKLFPALLTFLLVAAFLPFQSCEPEDNEDNCECDTCNLVRKPNIYIYPETTIQLELSLNFPMGGKIVTSIPEYGLGWNVTVTPEGTINDEYSYLFYESIQPDVWQMSEGWIIRKEDLKNFFTGNMALYGFSEREIKDFNEYWIPRLTGFPLFAIYPQEAFRIESVIQLNFSQQPDDVLRLFYIIKGIHEMPAIMITDPKIYNYFSRDGFHVSEWGVILR